MPSFDVAAKVDIQMVDNVVNVVHKEVTNRYDFKGTHVTIDLDKKSHQLKLEADSDMKMQQIVDVLISKAMKQGLDIMFFDLNQKEQPSGKIVKKSVPIKNGLSQEDAKKIVKTIKDSGQKVQAAIMDDIVRVTSKKIDDLQSVIQLLRQSDLKLPLQFTNMKS